MRANPRHRARARPRLEGAPHRVHHRRRALTVVVVVVVARHAFMGRRASVWRQSESRRMIQRAPTAFAHATRRGRCATQCVFASDDDGEREMRALVDVVVRQRFAFPERASASSSLNAGDDVDDDAPSTSVSAKAERFSFTLTKEDGARVVGVARRVGDEALVVLASAPWFDYFWTVLEKAHDEAFRIARARLDHDNDDVRSDLSREEALWDFLNRTIGEGAPKPGTSTTTPLPWTAFAGIATRSATLYAPNLKKEFNSGIRFTTLLDVGHVDAVVALFAALVTERRVVVVGSSVSALSGAVHAANAALYPMSWQHIFLPLLPEPFLDYLTAPMPFLVGLHSSLLPAMRELPCEDIFILNLDDGSFTYFEEDFDAMPSGPTTLLRVGLLRELERSRGEDAQAVARVFRTFFSTILGPYKRHIKGVVAHPPPKDAISAHSLWLDHDEFMSMKYGAMLAAMRGTQMYEVFVRRRLSMCAVVARKTGFIPQAEEIVDFDLEEPDLTISDLMMRGQALSEQFASASSRAFSAGSSLLKQTMSAAKESTMLKKFKTSFALNKKKFSASLEKFREKSSEDLYTRGVEGVESVARALSFSGAPVPVDALSGAPVIEPHVVPQPPSEVVEEGEEEEKKEEGEEEAPINTIDISVAENVESKPSDDVTHMTDAFGDLMSFEDASPTPTNARIDPGAELASLLDL